MYEYSFQASHPLLLIACFHLDVSTILSYFIYFCGVCVCAHSRTYPSMHTQRQWEDFECFLLFYFLKQCLSVNPELAISVRLADQRAPRIHQSWHPNTEVTQTHGHVWLFAWVRETLAELLLLAQKVLFVFNSSPQPQCSPSTVTLH